MITLPVPLRKDRNGELGLCGNELENKSCCVSTVTDLFLQCSGIIESG
jgi:hypothetical protein